jgi:carbon-monoxide dehydrogenase medium subunit
MLRLRLGLRQSRIAQPLLASETGLTVEFLHYTSRDEVLSALNRYGPDAVVVAGGTDLMLQLRRGDIAPRILVYIGRMPSREIISSPDGWRVDALTTHRQLMDHEQLGRSLSAVTEAAATVGGWQTQSVGTLGGNVCNASPAADLVAPLLVHDAVVQLDSLTGGAARMPLEEFIIGRRKTRRSPDQLLTSITLTNMPLSSGDGYFKVGRRSGMEVAIVGLAVRMTLAADLATIADIRIAACAAGPTPFRARAAENVLINSAPTAAAVAAAGAALVACAHPIDDRRGSARYRIAVLPRLLEHAVRKIVAKIVTRS